VSEIAAASQEQSSGIEQVGKAVMQMDEATQQNAALVEQAAAASQSIVSRATALNDLIAQYDIGEVVRATAVKPRRASAAPKPTERRDSKRPWTRPLKSAMPPASDAPVGQAPATRKAAGSGASADAEWTQF